VSLEYNLSIADLTSLIADIIGVKSIDGVIASPPSLPLPNKSVPATIESFLFN
jgi:hypothetical protein